jgi:hypothetical protein
MPLVDLGHLSGQHLGPRRQASLLSKAVASKEVICTYMEEVPDVGGRGMVIRRGGSEPADDAGLVALSAWKQKGSGNLALTFFIHDKISNSAGSKAQSL